ncbi:DUF166 domain-containing protein [Thermovenabulum gondwanense]|uniref:Thymidylate synthase n=1 Tax=Thermovenabulum gondwanense TaxID=520767 RepID=A0A162MB75_9FIRM|nr:DUF166 family protein [Thermovenabulum gondwanense]KYO64937.1 hypothetical protein ATZ99_17990 [Thermovenabulum gondwanense]
MEKYRLLLAAGKDDPIFPPPFYCRYSGEYIIRKFLPNLTFNKMGKGCISSECLEYKKSQVKDFTPNIAGLIFFPTVLPEILDEPESYLPDELPEHNVLIAAGVHPDLLVDLLKRAKKAGCKVFIAPKEDPKWIDKYLESKLKKICEECGIEYLFPKPFCSVKKTVSKLIDDFLTEFKMGMPEYRVEVDKKGYITGVEVIRSAPCGATYFVAYGLLGKRMGEEAINTANRLWHAYPCIASNAVDGETGDSVMHLAAHINLKAAEKNLRA